MKNLLLGLILLLAPVALKGQNPSNPPPTSHCHLFIDQENIWTLETVEDGGEEIVPILNIITFSPGKWEFRPRQIHIFDADGREARVEKFSMETGSLEGAYLSTFMPVLGNSFIGLELLGSFNDFAEPASVLIDLGESRFELQSVDCAEFERLAEKINRINLDSPDIREDFEVLEINPLGRIDLKPE